MAANKTALDQELEKAIREFLDQNPEIRQMLELMRISDEEYSRALLAYRVSELEYPTIGSTRLAAQNVNVSATNRGPARSA